jgi:hypothetical protein
MVPSSAQTAHLIRDAAEDDEYDDRGKNAARLMRPARRL